MTYRISVATTELCHCQGKTAGVSKTPAGGQVWSKGNLSLQDRKAHVAYKVSWVFIFKKYAWNMLHGHFPKSHGAI